MKLMLFTMIAIGIVNSECAKAAESDACARVEMVRAELDMISENIANVNTTRTPEGGPYRPKRLSCDEDRCEIVAESKITYVYDPDHVDANEIGYVASPDMDLMNEMSLIIDASRRFDTARADCNATK